MKKILAIAAVAALTAGVSAYAANPFSDVTPDDWAYQAVSDLSDQGVVEGYPDGTFKGERNMTRYELAQIIARLMAKEDQLNAEQRATLDKLAGEYADELANLGVRVSNLEKKVGNISWSGNARMRYIESYKADSGKSTGTWDGRMRIQAKAQVNDSTTVTGLLRQNMHFKDNDEGGTDMQRLYVTHNFGDKVSVVMGKYDEFAGQTGIMYDSEVKGAKVTYGDDAFNVTAGYARFNDWNDELSTLYSKEGHPDDKTREVAYARIAGAADKLSYDVEYYDAASADYKTWGAGLTYNFAGKFDVFGDFYQNTDGKGDPKLWTAGLGYGSMSFAKPGSWRLAAQYVKAEQGAYLGGSTFDTAVAQDLVLKSARWDSKAEEFTGDDITAVHFWVVSGDVGLAKNVGLHAEYAFDVSADGTKTDYDDLFSATINYKF